MTVTINGQQMSIEVPSHATVLDMIRGELDLTGAKPACDMGDCGACAVLVDGVPILACITLAAEVENTCVTTVEGVSNGPHLHPVQRAFHRLGAAQCGYCTPGFVVAAAALLEQTPHPSEAQIRWALSGNLCRCTGYTAIVAAVKEAAAETANADTGVNPAEVSVVSEEP